MSPRRIRKYPSGHQKRIKKKRTEELIQSQKELFIDSWFKGQSKIEALVSEQHIDEELNDNERAVEEYVDDKEDSESLISNSQTEPRNLCSVPVKLCPRGRIRKQPSGHKKRLKKRRIEQLTQFQGGALDRFTVKDQQASVEGLVNGHQHDEAMNDNKIVVEEVYMSIEGHISNFRTAIPEISAPALLIPFLFY